MSSLTVAMIHGPPLWLVLEEDIGPELGSHKGSHRLPQVLGPNRTCLFKLGSALAGLHVNDKFTQLHSVHTGQPRVTNQPTSKLAATAINVSSGQKGLRRSP